MSYIKKRVRKIKTNDPDEFVSLYQQILDWAGENLKLVFFTGGAIILVTLLSFGLLWNRANRDMAASEALAGAVSVYQAQETGDQNSDTREAIEGLKRSLKSFREISSSYPGTVQGNSATLYASNILVRIGSYDEAAASLEDLVAREPEFSGKLQVSYLLGRAYEAGGNFEKALSVYGGLLEGVGVEMRPGLMMDRARCFELGGDKEQAVETYRNVVQDFAESVFGLKARARLAVLGEAAEENL